MMMIIKKIPRVTKMESPSYRIRSYSTHSNLASVDCCAVRNTLCLTLLHF